MRRARHRRAGARWGAMLGCCLLGVASCEAGEAGADDSSVRVSTGLHYSTGSYGTSRTTEILYAPVTTRAETGPWSLQVTVPYLRISGGGGVVQGPNGPVRTTSGTTDGLGDVLARGSYTVESRRRWMPFLELEGLVKFPTASRSDGLGTGRFDFGLETELTWAAGRLTPFAMIGYRFLGSPPDAPLHDVYLGSVGAQYRVRDRVNVGLFYDHRQAASAVSGPRRELVPFVSFRAQHHWSISVYASAGFARGSPEAGTGLEVGYTL